MTTPVTPRQLDVEVAHRFRDSEVDEAEAHGDGQQPADYLDLHPVGPGYPIEGQPGLDVLAALLRAGE